MQPIPFETNALLYLNDPQYTEAIEACKKTASPNLVMLQTKWFLKFMIQLNCTVFIKTAVNFKNV